MTTKHFKKFALSAIIILTASLLSACGGGSSPDFAPADQAAFNDKFVGSPVISDDGTSVDFDANNQFASSDGDSGTYAYTKTGENTAEIKFTDAAGDFCTENFTFTSAISGTYDETCNDGSADNGTFAFDIAPANQNAFNTKFVNQTVSGNIDTFNILANSKYSSTATLDGDTITIYGDYFYTKNSANKITISIDVDSATVNGSYVNAPSLASFTCTYTMTFTSTLSGTFNETCSDGVTEETYSGNFKFSGSN